MFSTGLRVIDKRCPKATGNFKVPSKPKILPISNLFILPFAPNR